MMDAGTILGRAVIAILLVAAGYILMSIGGRLYLKFIQLRRRNTKWPEEIWSGAPVLLCFSTAQCAVCKYQQAKCLDQVRKHFKGNGADVDIRKFDAAERADISGMLGVVTVPTTVILDGDGKVTELNTGLVKTKLLIEQFEKVLN